MPKYIIKVTDFAKYPFVTYDTKVDLGTFDSIRSEYDGGRLTVVVKGRKGTFNFSFSVSISFTVRFFEEGKEDE